MSTGPESFQGGNSGPYRDDAGRPDPPERPAETPRSTALDQVLHETLELLSREKISQAELAALRDVARRFRDQPLEADPVTRELVSALLEKRYRAAAPTERDRRQMAAEIAEYLHETPTTLSKLQDFWQRLQESAP